MAKSRNIIAIGGGGFGANPGQGIKECTIDIFGCRYKWVFINGDTVMHPFQFYRFFTAITCLSGSTLNQVSTTAAI